MKAAVLSAIGQPMTIQDVSVEKPRRREVLLRTAAAGLCHSDLHFIEGKYPTPLPTVLGHEASAVVESVGEDVTHVRPGDHVITCLSVFCGHCECCLTGHMSLCQDPGVKPAPGSARRLSSNGAHLNQFLNLSAFAQQMVVHENAVVKVRPDLPLDVAALLGCAVITGYGAVVHTAGIRPGATVVVIGCGGIGLAAINCAALAGAARIIAIDKDAGKLPLARAVGATDVLEAGIDRLPKVVVEMTSGGADHVFECIGLKQTVEQGFSMLRPGGTETVVGMVPPGVKIELNGVDFLREKRIQGCMMGSNRFRIDIPRLVEFFMQGRLKLQQLISQHLRLEQINEGFALLQTGGVARSVINFDQQ